MEDKKKPAHHLDFSSTDVNECLTPGVCVHGKCINLEGSFRCSCEQGYTVTSDEKGCQGTKMLKSTFLYRCTSVRLLPSAHSLLIQP